jgi:hypothetical protein
MLVFFVILLSVLLTASIIGIILLWKAGERQMTENDILNQNVNHYVEWITDWRAQVLRTWAHMQMLDDKQMFEKDDEVGVVFRDIKTLIQSLNDRTQEEITEEGE